MLGSQRIIQQKNQFFKELKFHEWRVYPAIPSDDIVWQNVGNLMKESKCQNFIGYLQPILISSVCIFAILTLESLTLHYVPFASTIILYITMSLLVLFAFYATPYLVFNSVDREKLAQKSHKESAYMRRLIIIEILNVFVIPLFFNIFLVLFGPEHYRGRGGAYHSLVNVDAKIAACIDIIAYVDETLLRFLLQVTMAVVYF